MTKTAFYFDTNAYIDLVDGLSLDEARARGRVLHQTEEQHGYYSEVAPYVIREFLYHLVDPSRLNVTSLDHHQRHHNFVKGLVLMSEHIGSTQRNLNGSLPEQEDFFSLFLFGQCNKHSIDDCIENLEFARRLADRAPDIFEFTPELHEYRRLLETRRDEYSNSGQKETESIRKEIDALPDKAIREIWDATEFHLKHKAPRQLALQYAHACAERARIQFSDEIALEAAERLQYSFPIFISHSVSIASKSLRPRGKIPANDVVDLYLLAYLRKPGDDEIPEVLYSMVTTEKELKEVARQARMPDRILTLKEYLSMIGLACN